MTAIIWWGVVSQKVKDLGNCGRGVGLSKFRVKRRVSL